MQLLMTVKQGKAGIVGDEIYLGFGSCRRHSLDGDFTIVGSTAEIMLTPGRYR